MPSVPKTICIWFTLFWLISGFRTNQEVCHPAYLTYMQSKIARRNINNLRYADDTTLLAESKEELKRLLMKVKEQSEKASLKFNI